MLPSSFIISCVFLLLWTAAYDVHARDSLMKDSTVNKLNSGKRLNRQEKQEVENAEREAYKKLRRQGMDEVSNTQEAAALRNYRLRKRKRIGLFFKREAHFSQILFPKSRPANYQPQAPIYPVSTLMKARRSLASYDLSMHPAFDSLLNELEQRKTSLGSKLEGYTSETYKTMNFLDFKVKQDMSCKVIGDVTKELSVKQLRFLRQLIQLRYRMHLTLDKMPVLMRSKELNYAVKGMPIGFEAPPNVGRGTNNNSPAIFLYNHWRFIVTYHEDPSLFEGVRITGFDVHPVSIVHKIIVGTDQTIQSCGGGENPPDNNPDTYFTLQDISKPKTVTFSYQVEWVQRELPWEDRWDVYFLWLPDEAIHYFSMLNSVICAIILAAVIAAALVRVFRKDLAGGTKKDNGWKHLKGDVFRLPESPMLLSVMVGNGLHLLVASILTMTLNICHVINTMVVGDALTAFLFVYATTGSIGGYVSARLYKLCGGQDSKRNATLTSTVLSGSMVLVFCLFNMASDAIGSSCSDFVSVVELILLWACISVNLTHWGAQLGEKAPTIELPTKTNDTIRPIPESRWTKYNKLSLFACGVLCFGVLYVELHFLMTAIWFRETYLGLGYMLIVTLMATTVCAECTICVCYFQLNKEDHQWWWTAFWNGSSVGGYMAYYTFTYQFKHLAVVGLYSNLAYYVCMFFATVCIGMVAGSIGFLSCLWFTRTIYGAIDSDDDDAPIGDEDEEVIFLPKAVSEYSSSPDSDDSQ